MYFLWTPKESTKERRRCFETASPLPSYGSAEKIAGAEIFTRLILS